MTNITKTMLDQILSDLEEKFVKDFNKKKIKKISLIKADLESKIINLIKTNEDLQKKMESLEKRQTNITPPLFSSLLSEAKPAEF